MTPKELEYAMAYERLCSAYCLTHTPVSFIDVEEN